MELVFAAEASPTGNSLYFSLIIAAKKELATEAKTTLLNTFQ